MSLNSTVLLGVVDEEIDKSVETSSFLNKIGGHPDFANGLRGSVRCSLCDSMQKLVAQIYCPLDDSQYHRTLYIFCCIKSCCWSKSEGWTVLRQMFLDQICDTLNSNNVPAVTSWGDDANDWDIEGTFTSTTLPINATESKDDTSALCHELDSLNLTIPSNNCHSLPSHFDHRCGSSYRTYYINVLDEKDCIGQANGRNSSLDNIDKAVTSHSHPDLADMSTFAGKCQINAESYEPATYEDKAFHKFMKSIKLFPKQVMRYCYSGSPLVPKDVTITSTPCSCGSERVFEAQLMPSLLPYLKDGDMVEFSTVLIYTCSTNCTVNAGYSLTTEYLFYIDDPDLSYFKGQKDRLIQ